MSDLLPVSAVVATKNRAESLRRTLQSLARQNFQPAEIIAVDASGNDHTQAVCESSIPKLRSKICWNRATEHGAAVQRNHGVALAKQQFIWFFDDDIVFENDCVVHLWNALQTELKIGGVNAMIINQSYSSPGAVSRAVFTLLHGRREKTFAGKVIGPAVNLLPEDNDALPEIVPVEWLNTTCTMYRRAALPTPPFDSFFHDYSLMEDLALSIRVSQRGWTLANARHARIFHDSQSGRQKRDVAGMASMEFRNRYYVMTAILGRRRVTDHLRLVLWECFAIVSGLTSIRGLRDLPKVILGKLQASITSKGDSK